MPDHFEIAPEDQIVCHVEVSNRREQPDIRLGDVRPEQIRLVTGLTEVLLDAVQRLEKRVHVRIYASCVAANPVFYTPLLILSYTHSFMASMSARRGAGYSPPPGRLASRIASGRR